jgi:hypothetical protein
MESLVFTIRQKQQALCQKKKEYESMVFAQQLATLIANSLLTKRHLCITTFFSNV